MLPVCPSAEAAWRSGCIHEAIFCVQTRYGTARRRQARSSAGGHARTPHPLHSRATKASPSLQRCRVLDRAVMVFLVATNVAALAQLSLQWSTFIGVVNGSLAAALLACSFKRPAWYARYRCARRWRSATYVWLAT